MSNPRPDAAVHGHGEQAHYHSHGAVKNTGNTAHVTDPVCGMQADPATSKHRLEHNGQTFHFCSAGCRAKFEGDPGKYLAPRTSETEPAPRGVIYTCPMHPQIRQSGPGNCPICGMALEPLQVAPKARPNPELQDMQRRLWIGLAACRTRDFQPVDFAAGVTGTLMAGKTGLG